MATPEGSLLRLTLDYLAARHVLAFRMQSAFTVAEYKGKKRAFRSGTVGMADILAFKETPRGCPEAPSIIPVWLEIKTPMPKTFMGYPTGGRQTDLQKSFQAQVESHGHVYAIIRSLEDVEAIL